MVTKADFDHYVNQAKAQAKTSKQTFPKVGTYAYNQYAAQVIIYLVQLQLIEQAATTWHITVTDKQVADQIATIQKAYPGAKFEQALKAQGLTLPDLKKLIRDQLVSQNVYNHVVGTSKVTDAQALAYYKAHKSTYEQPEKRHVRHILVKTKAEALKVRALLVGGASWKTVAAKYSTDPGTKKKGGDLGEITPGEMVPTFDKAAFSLPVDKISQPVKSPYGWHVIEVLGITKAKVQTFAQVEATIKSTISSANAQKLWQKWLTNAQKKANIQYASGYDPAQLKKTKPPTATPSPTASPAASGTASPAPNPSTSP